MITAVFFKKNNAAVGFSIKGHADYSDNGNDIVCASVSSAVQFAANLITECFEIKANIKVLGDEINLTVTDSSNIDNAVKVINALMLHLKLLAKNYKGTIKITFSEV